MTKRKLVYIITICLLVALLCCMPVLAAEGEGEAEFSCFTYDSLGHRLDGYCAGEGDTWYLFLSSTQSIEETELHFTGSIDSASAGTLDAENGVLSAAFAESGDSVELTDAEGGVYTVVVMQSNLPSVYIDLNDTTLDDIHADKDAKHKGNSIYVMDPAGEYDLTVEESVEIKGRGNSTWREYEKKAYQIKFDDKTSVMGMGKAKKWVLLANASDDSMMRSQLAYTMAQNMDMDFVTSFEYVDLWIEGEYRGTFLFGEKVEPGSSRLDLQNDSGALFEHDEDFYMEEDYWFLNKTLNRHFTMKEIVEEEEEIIDSAIADFDEALSTFVSYLYSTPSDEASLAALEEMIDVDSFIKYFLINEFALNRESFSTSFYWYKDGPEDVIHLGPIWDFDTCMGNDGEPYTASYGDTHVIFHYLLAIPEFYARTMELLEEYRDELESMAGNVAVIKEEIASSAEMNYIRWDVLGKPNPKGGADFYPSFDEAVEALHSWLVGRAGAFSIEQTTTVTSVVSEDCQEMEVHFDDGEKHDKVIFAVWSQEGGIDDIAWYTGEENEQGGWEYSLDLGNHNSAGIYYINAYTNNEEELLGSGRTYVETARTARYPLSTEIADDGVITVKMGDESGSLSDARFALWLISNQENTLQWLDAAKAEDELWTVSYPLCAFNMGKADNLSIHAYSGEDFLNGRLVPISAPVAHAYAEGQEACSLCGQVPVVEEPIAKTPMYRLFNPNTGEHFYTGSEEERDNLSSLGWQYEGIAWHAPISEGEPVHRLFNPNSGDHHYTMSQDEIDMLVEAGWQYEGVAWNSAPEGSAQYRLWNPNADLGSHHYTGSTEERDFLVSLGWILEGIGWYGIIEE